MKRLSGFVFVLVMMLSLAATANCADPASNKSFAGQWMNETTTTGGLGARYALSGDGTFIYGASETGVFEPELYKTGTWSVAGGELRLAVKARWIVPMGNMEDIVPSAEIIILNDELLKRLCDPAEVETYSLAQGGTDPQTGKETIQIDGVTFYKFDEQTNLFDEFYALPKPETGPSPAGE